MKKMRLVLIDENLSIVKEYENNTTIAEVDGMFAKMESLILAKSKAAPTLLAKGKQPPPIFGHNTEAVTTLSGSNLTNWFQGQMEYYEQSKREREKVKERAEKYLQTRAGIWRNNLWAALMNWISRKLNRKAKKETNEIKSKQNN